MELKQLNNILIKSANILDQKLETKKADLLDTIIKESSLKKIAQYVGVIGYVLKQNRCMSNCIRRKRVSKEGSMQEVILECLKEYQDGQDYKDEVWTKKYASVIQKEPNGFNNAHILFLSELKNINNIDRHVNNLKKASKYLKELSIDDSHIEHLLNSYELLENIKNEVL